MRRARGGEGSTAGFRAIVAVVRHRGVAGATCIRLRGLIARRMRLPGRYRFVAAARDDAGNRSLAAAVNLRASFSAG